MIESALRKEALSISLTERGIHLRSRILTILEKGGRGHVGPALSILEIVSTIYGRVMDISLIANKSPLRDRFILSKGHGCLALYAVLEEFGLLDGLDLESYCKYDSPFGGHPESASTSAIEFSTGSLGHGLSVAVGMAKAAKLRKENWRVYVLVGDGELNEGSIWEAAAHASKHRLDNLYVIVDYNNMQASGSADEVLNMGPLLDKWRAFGFDTMEINGHDEQIIEETLKQRAKPHIPRCLIAYTVKGKGILQSQNSSEWHHKAKISIEEIALLKKELLT